MISADSSKKISVLNREKETGMALVLLALVVLYFRSHQTALIIPIGLLVLTIAWPRVFSGLSRVWFGISRIIGSIVSKVILTLLFFLLVTPVGIIRRLFGADPLRLKEWKKGNSSVLAERDGVIEPGDIEYPY